MEIRLAEEKDREEWDRFIEKNAIYAFDQFFKLFSWLDHLAKIFNYKPYYLILKEKQEIKACFPLMLIKSKIFGNRLISLPFTARGAGPCIKKEERDIDRIIKYFHKKIIKIAKENNVKFIQVGSSLDTKFLQYFLKRGYKKSFEDCTFILNISNPINNIWKSFNKKVRNTIRRAEKTGMSIEKDENNRDIKDLYTLHLENMKLLGTPPYPISLLKNRKSIFGENFKIFFAKYKQERIAAISILLYKDAALWCDGVCRNKYRNLNPISLLLWKTICYLKEHGYRTFDMGISRKGSTHYAFKKKWNPQIFDVPKLYYFCKKAEPIDLRVAKYSKLSNIWKKYVPNFFAKIIGPILRKKMGT